MFDNKDFNKAAHLLMIASVAMLYNAVYEYARSWGISWVNIPIGDLIKHRSQPLNPDSSIIYLVLIFLVPAIAISLTRCVLRIKRTGIAMTSGLIDYFKTFFGYFVLFILLIIFVPIIGRIAIML